MFENFKETEIFNLLPHKGVSRFVKEILELSEERIVCTGRIPSDSPYLDNGRVPTYVALEIAAQASVLLERRRIRDRGYSDLENIKYLVSARKLVCLCNNFSPEELVMVFVNKIGSAPPINIFEFFTYLQNNKILNGEFTTYSFS